MSDPESPIEKLRRLVNAPVGNVNERAAHLADREALLDALAPDLLALYDAADAICRHSQWNMLARPGSLYAAWLALSGEQPEETPQ